MENFDLPAAIREDQFHADLVQLINGQPVKLTEYTFNKSDATPKEIVLTPAPIIVAEGIFTLHYERGKKAVGSEIICGSSGLSHDEKADTARW